MKEQTLDPEELWRKFGDDLLRFATALVGPDDALDAVAETFARVVAMSERELQVMVDPRNYLHRMVLNDARMMKRSQARRQRREWRASDIPAHVELLSDDGVLRALGSLSVQQRAAVFLTYWHDLAPVDVADLMAVSTGSVKRHLARARAKLRKEME